MTREEHLLTILIEECSEVIKEASKALRFGLLDGDPNQTPVLSNSERITLEIGDLYGIIQICIDEELIDAPFGSAIEGKKEKIEKYLRYSKSVGKLE